MISKLNMTELDRMRFSGIVTTNNGAPQRHLFSLAFRGIPFTVTEHDPSSAEPKIHRHCSNAEAYTSWADKSKGFMELVIAWNESDDETNTWSGVFSVNDGPWSPNDSLFIQYLPTMIIVVQTKDVPDSISRYLILQAE